MKFGKLIRASVSSRMPQWEGSVLQYKRLKQAIKALVSEAGGAEPDVLVERFTTILDEEVERVNDFYMDQIEEAVIILHSLKQHIAQIVTASDAPAAHQLRVVSQQSAVARLLPLVAVAAAILRRDQLHRRRQDPQEIRQEARHPDRPHPPRVVHRRPHGASFLPVSSPGWAR